MRTFHVTVIAIGAALAGAAVMLLGQAKTFQSKVFDWTKLEAKATSTGARRDVTRAPTPTLDELEIHITTLNPGQAPHAPHRHPEEELMIVREGTLETTQNGIATRVGPGSVIFQASNELHGLRNVGTTQATYHVISWRVPHTVKEAAMTWRNLFDGTSLDAWRGYHSDNVPAGWHVVDGTLAKETPTADIVSKDEFGDFELELEWKIGEAGNSGIFYRGTEEYDHIYWSAPEYQLLDDIKASDNKSRLTCAGAAYALYPSPAGHLKPVGDWNQTRIVARGSHIEHWLNGFKLLEYELWSPDWETKVKASKFASYANYGRAKRGHIALQGDHAGTLGFRNIRVRELD